MRVTSDETQPPEIGPYLGQVERGKGARWEETSSVVNAGQSPSLTLATEPSAGSKAENPFDAERDED